MFSYDAYKMVDLAPILKSPRVKVIYYRICTFLINLRVTEFMLCSIALSKIIKPS